MGLERMATTAIREAGGAAPPQNQVLDFLTKYIPGELIALYIPLVAGLPAIERIEPTFSADVAGKWVYWAFVISSPFLFLFIYMSKAERDELIQLKYPSNWPLFRMAAASIAFAVWALAVPDNPILKPAGEDRTNALAALIAGILAPIVSFFLSGIEVIMNRLRSVPPTR
jgi:hypothetical protein